MCKEDGIPAVISLHQLEFARQIADRIIGLGSGRVLFDGTPEQLSAAVIDQIYGGVDTMETKTRSNFLGTYYDK